MNFRVRPITQFLMVLQFGILMGCRTLITHESLKYNSGEVALTGTIVKETFAGPPNYESIANGDEPEDYWILKLDKAVDVAAGADEMSQAESNVQRLQLVLGEGDYEKYRSLLDHPAMVKGTLFHQISVHHKTAVLIEVNDVQTNAFSPDYFKAVLKHAKSGDAEAQMQVAYCYHEGTGVGQNKTESVKWMERAAKQGMPQAESLVGQAYYVGLDVKMDDKKGIAWIEKAANQGEPAAIHYLGAAYYLGKGKKQNYFESYKWSLVFRETGRAMIPDDTVSLDAQLAEIEQKLTPVQIILGKEEAKKLEEQLSKFPRYCATN
jgi:hypothetical protein